MTRIWKCTTHISELFLFVLMILVIVNVVMRRFFNAPIFGVTELVCYASLASASFGLAQTEWHDGNVRMTLVMEKTNAKFSTYLNLIINIIGTISFAFVAYLLVIQAINRSSQHQVSTELKIPMYIVTGILALGFVLLLIALIAKVIFYILRIKNKCYVISSPVLDNDLSDDETAGKEKVE